MNEQEARNLALLEKLISRIKEALDKKQDTNLKFDVEIKGGRIKTISWETEFTVNFT